MRRFSAIPTIQLTIFVAALITCLSHIEDMLFWSALIGFAVAMLRYGAKVDANTSGSNNYFPEEEEQEPTPIDAGKPELAVDFSLTLQDPWQEVEAMDEQQEETGTTMDADAETVDAGAETIAEPMPNQDPQAKEKAPAARWGYRGRNILPPTPATTDTEVSLITTRLRLFLPKETGKNRKIWSALCKQIGLTGYTSMKDAKPSTKALWLDQRGVSFEQVVRATLALAA